MALSIASPWQRKSERFNPIPQDLLPKTTAQLNEAWANKTYKYFCHFDDTVGSKVVNDSDDLLKWKTCAIGLMTDLKARGLSAARNEIVRVAKNTFKLESHLNKQIVCFEDVVNLFQDADWYFDDLEYNRNMLYVFQYGIFRNGNNTWLHDASYDWMSDYKVVYEDQVPTYQDKENTPSPSKTPKPKSKKGFILELLHLKASNTIQDRFLRTTRKYLGQHLLCRNKKQHNKVSTCANGPEPQLLTFNHYNAWLVLDPTHKYNLERCGKDSTSKLTESVQYAIQGGMSKESIMQLINNCYEQLGENIATYYFHYVCNTEFFIHFLMCHHIYNF